MFLERTHAEYLGPHPHEEEREYYALGGHVYVIETRPERSVPVLLSHVGRLAAFNRIRRTSATRGEGFVLAA